MTIFNAINRIFGVKSSITPPKDKAWFLAQFNRFQNEVATILEIYPKKAIEEGALSIHDLASYNNNFLILLNVLRDIEQNLLKLNSSSKLCEALQSAFSAACAEYELQVVMLNGIANRTRVKIHEDLIKAEALRFEDESTESLKESRSEKIAKLEQDLQFAYDVAITAHANMRIFSK